MTIFVLVISLLTVGGFASGYGNVAGIFDLSTSARAAGMGGAFVALADDASAVFYNPAGLGWINDISLSSLVARQFDAVNYASLQFALPYFGAAVLYLDSGLIEGGEDVFRYASGGGVVSTGFNIGPVGIGGRFKVYRATSPNDVTGWAFDPGILVVTDLVRVGLLIENAYSEPILFPSHTEDWTPLMRIGIALTLAPSDGVGVNATVEGAGLFSGSPRLYAGFETYVDGLAARVGYDGDGVTFGLSVRFSSFQIDWAYITRDAFPDTHRVSLSFSF
ncbi:MAG TPA: hypothetical protein ENL23_01445 [Candidatus Acetothermia bacterium]|nr:hypothetical protein [Candidatus Acetothermia bacterium]